MTGVGRECSMDLDGVCDKCGARVRIVSSYMAVQITEDKQFIDERVDGSCYGCDYKFSQQETYTQPGCSGGVGDIVEQGCFTE
jgi:hypothetical protein